MEEGSSAKPAIKTQLSQKTNIEEGTLDKPDINAVLLQETHIEEGTSDFPNINTELLQDTHFKKAFQTSYLVHCLGRLDCSKILLYSKETFEILGLIE